VQKLLYFTYFTLNTAKHSKQEARLSQGTARQRHITLEVKQMNYLQFNNI